MYVAIPLGALPQVTALGGTTSGGKLTCTHHQALTRLIFSLRIRPHNGERRIETKIVRKTSRVEDMYEYHLRPPKLHMVLLFFFLLLFPLDEKYVSCFMYIILALIYYVLWWL